MIQSPSPSPPPQKHPLLRHNLEKLHPPILIDFRPHRKRHLHSSAQMLALVLHLPENRDVFPLGEGSFDGEFQTAAVPAHVGESLCDCLGAGVGDGGVPAGGLGGFGDVPWGGC